MNIVVQEDQGPEGKAKIEAIGRVLNREGDPGATKVTGDSQPLPDRGQDLVDDHNLVEGMSSNNIECFYQILLCIQLFLTRYKDKKQTASMILAENALEADLEETILKTGGPNAGVVHVVAKKRGGGRGRKVDREHQALQIRINW